MAERCPCVCVGGPQRSVLFLSRRSLFSRSLLVFLLRLFPSVFASATVAPDPLWPPDGDIPADFFYIVDAKGVTRSVTQHVWLLAGQSFILASKTDEELVFNPKDMKKQALAYKRPDCKLDAVVELQNLFPDVDGKTLWAERSPSSAEGRTGYKKIYKFQNPLAESLPSSLTEFCLLVSTPKAAASKKNVGEDGGGGEAGVPTLTLVIHSSAFCPGVGMSLFASLSAILSFFLSSP